VFTVEVLAGDSVLGRGSGRSKRAAEMEAARAALQSFKEAQTWRVFPQSGAQGSQEHLHQL
jgi:hypothetical protein